MLRRLFFFLVLAMFVACSDDDEKNTAEDVTVNETVDPAPDADDGTTTEEVVETEPVAISANIPTWYRNRESAVCLTFDDGCENQFTIAQPIIDAYGIKVTFYIIFNSPNYTYLKSAVVAEHEIGCHTLTYNSLTAYSTAEEMEADFAKCKELMNDNLGVQMLTLAYPNCVNPGNNELM